MIILVIAAVIFAFGLAGTILFSVFSGAGVLLFICASAIVCVLSAVRLLLRLLAGGVFSLLKCVVWLFTMLIPAVNVISLIALIIIAHRNLSDRRVI